VQLGVDAVGDAVRSSNDSGSTTFHETVSPSLKRNVNALVWMPRANIVGTPESGPTSVVPAVLVTVKLFAAP
jgi:hypothetical protein